MLWWLSARRQQRKERQALELQQKEQVRLQYEVYLLQQRERDRQARISNPKCKADLVLRHEAEADEVISTAWARRGVYICPGVGTCRSEGQGAGWVKMLLQG
jgi:hypothetical protein